MKHVQRLQQHEEEHDAVENGRLLRLSERYCNTVVNAETKKGAWRFLFMYSLTLSAFALGFMRWNTRNKPASESRALQQQKQNQQRGNASANAGDSADMLGNRGPSKGDTDCGSFYPGPYHSGRNPCHQEDDSGIDDESGNVHKPMVPPSELPEGDSSSTESLPTFVGQPQPPENIVDLTVFVALDPDTPSVAHRVVSLLTSDMNETIDNMNFYYGMPGEGFVPGKDGLPRPEEDEFTQPEKPPVEVPRRNATNPEEAFETLTPKTETEESMPFQNREIEGDEGVALGDTSQRGNSRPQRFNMFYVRVDSRVELRQPNRWWWRHDINYLCHWEDNEQEVAEDKMKEIGRNMTTTVKRDLVRLNSELRSLTDSKVLMLEVYLGIYPPERESTPEPVAATLPPLEGLNAREWTWSRYLGFSVFLGTFSGLMIASQVGAIRRRKEIRQQVWGNLASEEGVKELLSTGWILRDDRMEVYDRDGVGYREDDSMLIGGYEQREPGPGTEIVAPTHTTHDLTSTRGASTVPRDASTRQEDP